MSASAEDAGGLASLRLLVGGVTVAEASGHMLLYNLSAHGLEPGPHRLELRAQDLAGHVTRREVVVQVIAPVRAAEPTLSRVPTSVGPIATALPMMRPCRFPCRPVGVR